MKTQKARVPQKVRMGGTNFLISIYHQENHSWQGTIQWLDTGKKVHFRSELEMMVLIQSAVQVNQSKEQELRNWEDDKKSDAC